ncbi:MAG: hypothetical protein BHW10_02325 [Clostridium sp. CAG:307_30_263]|mgnify:CR=1 FL=1|nr:MAG: hypothetical protein BHW10_02325 [Clostridium sp. CAG:307_30_263]
MLSSFTQIEKDGILYANIHIKEEVEDDFYSLFGGTKKTTKTIERDRTVDEIESLLMYVNVQLELHQLDIYLWP